MKIGKFVGLCCLGAFLACLAGWSVASAAEMPKVDVSSKLQEMPLLTGEMWQKMSPDSKIAFLWGIGHVVTIEENVIKKHPEQKRRGFVAKLAEGLGGQSMDSIIQILDGYYQEYPSDLELPVMRVLWAEVVLPRLKADTGGTPASGEK